MIFLTVGTHEQQFDRLIRWVDELDQPSFIQYGFSQPPKVAKGEKLIAYEKVRELTQTADVVIVQGGAGSILTALDYNRVPVAVPRYAEFDEHVDDHQLEIVEKMADRGLVVPLLKDGNLVDAIEQAKLREQEKATAFQKNNQQLVDVLDNFIAEL